MCAIPSPTKACSLEHAMLHGPTTLPLYVSKPRPIPVIDCHLASFGSELVCSRPRPPVSHTVSDHHTVVRHGV